MSITAYMLWLLELTSIMQIFMLLKNSVSMTSQSSSVMRLLIRWLVTVGKINGNSSDNGNCEGIFEELLPAAP